MNGRRGNGARRGAPGSSNSFSGRQNRSQRPRRANSENKSALSLMMMEEQQQQQNEQNNFDRGMDVQQHQQQQQQQQSLPSQLNFAANTSVANSSSNNNNHIFEQLWKGIAQLQHESGDYSNALQAKTRELENAQMQVSQLNKQNEEVRARELRLTKQVETLQDDLAYEREQATKYQDEMASQREHSQKRIRDMEEMHQERLRELQNTQQNEEMVRIAFEKQGHEMEKLKGKCSQLLKELEERKKNSVDLSVLDEKNALNEKVALLNQQLKHINQDREEMDHTISQLTDENWNLKISIEEKEKENDSLKMQSESVRSEVEKHETTIVKMKTIHDELLHKLKQKEQSMLDQEEQVKRLQAQVQVLQQHLDEARSEQANSMDAVQSNEEEMERVRGECEAQLEKMRVAMRQVQDKHLQDVVRFEEQRKKLESKLLEEEGKVEQSDAAAQKLANELTALEQQLAQFHQSQDEIKAKYVTEVQSKFQAKIEELLAEQTREVTQLKTQVAEAKAAARTEAKEAQRYKNTLAKAAKEEQHKFIQEIEDYKKQVDQLNSELEAADENKAELRQRIESLEHQLDLLRSESESKEEELQKALIATQHQVSNGESHFAREAEKLRGEVERYRKQVQTLEEEKRDLIVDCKNLNGEVADITANLQRVQDDKQETENNVTKLRSEVERLRKEINLIESENEEKMESLQKELDEHVASRRDALSKCESLRAELKYSKKEAAEHVTSFSMKAESLQNQLTEAQAELKTKETELDEKVEALRTVEGKLKDLQSNCDRLNDVHSTEVTDMVQQLEDKETELQNAKLETSRLKQNLDDADAQLKQMEQTLQTSQQAFKRQEQELKSNEQAKLDALNRIAAEQENLRLLKQELSRRKDDLQEVNKELANLRADKNSLERGAKAKEVKLNSDIEQLRTAFQQARSDHERCQKELNEAKAQLEAYKANSELSFQQTIEAQQAKEGELNQIITQLRSEMKEQEAALLDEKQNLKRVTRQGKLESERSKGEIERLQQALSSAQANGINLLQELEEKTSAYDQLAADFENMGKSMQSLERKLANVEKSKHELEQELEKEKENCIQARNQMQQVEVESRNKLRQETEAHQATKKQLSVSRQEKDWLNNETNIKMSALNRQVENLESDLKRKDDEIQTLEGKLRLFQEEQDKFQEAANQAMSKLRAETDMEQTEQRHELEITREAAEKSSQMCSQLEQEKGFLLKKCKDLEQQISRAKSQHEELREELEAATKNYKEVVQAKRKVDAELKKLKFENQDNTMISTSNPNYDMEQAIFKAEQEAYEQAREEYKELMEKLEKSHAEEIKQLKKSVEGNSISTNGPITPQRHSFEAFTMAFTHSPRNTLNTTSSAPSAFLEKEEQKKTKMNYGESMINGKERKEEEEEDDDDDLLIRAQTAESDYFEFGPKPPSHQIDFDDGHDDEAKFTENNEMQNETDMTIMDTAKFIESRKKKQNERRATFDSAASFRLPAAKGAVPLPETLRHSFDSFETLEKKLKHSQSMDSFQQQQHQQSKKKNGKKKNNTKLPKMNKKKQ